MMGYITDRTARAIKPDDKPILGGITGFYLFPGSARGRGKWIIRYVSPVTGKRRDMGLGSFPDTGVARAIEKALAAREQIQDGIDPILARQTQRKIPTFEQAARDQWELLAPGFKNDKHKAQWIASLEQHVFPTIGGIRVDHLETAHFGDVLAPIWLTIPETAKRVKMRCNAVMAACRARKFILANPLDDVGAILSKTNKKEAAPVKHHPAMPWQEIPAFIRDHLNRSPLWGARAALMFTILTAARSGEVRGATWSEIDLNAKLWTIPDTRMKAKREHRVPLSDDAVVLLRGMRGDETPAPDALVFPALRGGQLSDMALTSLLRKAEAASDIQGRIATAHGFRSSFRNWCADHGINSDLAERSLAHTISNKVQAAYERTDRFTARIKLMQSWADHAMGRTTENVIQIRNAG
jgi:integrase